MDPTAALLLLSLAGPLDSSSFAVREQARKQLNAMEPAACAMAMPALLHCKSIEVSESARRFANHWHRMWFERELATINGKLDKLLFAAVHGPIEDRPWRALNDLEMTIASFELWRPWAMDVWRDKAKPMLDNKYRGSGHYYDHDQPQTVFCAEWCDLCQGHLSSVIWQCRMIEANSGLFTVPTGEDW